MWAIDMYICMFCCGAAQIDAGDGSGEDPEMLACEIPPLARCRPCRDEISGDLAELM